MGLDMYLEKHTYVGAEYEHRKVTGTIDLKADGKQIPVEMKKVSKVIERVAYWRKANAIHLWFVDNVQEGNDDCGDYYVSRECLQKLLDTVNEVIPTLNKREITTVSVETGWDRNGTTYGDLDVFTNTKTAEELLPTQGGFFFGTTDYSVYYLEDLGYTKKVLEEILSEPESFEVSYYYASSW